MFRIIGYKGNYSKQVIADMSNHGQHVAMDIPKEYYGLFVDAVLDSLEKIENCGLCKSGNISLYLYESSPGGKHYNLTFRYINMN